MTSTRSRLMPSLALALALLGCSTPLAGINLTGAPAAVPAVPAAVPSIAEPAGIAPAAPVATSAPPMAVDGRVRLQGSVLLQDTPIADASLTAIDLATGKAIALKPWTDAGGGSAGATLRTDAQGAFELELPKLAADQVVKLVAVSGGQTYTALFDSRGRAIGGSPSAGAKYVLKQGQATLVTILVRLTAASTAASKAFEGVLKLQFQLPAEQVVANLNQVIDAAQKAATELETALARKPQMARSLVNAVGAQGEIGDIDKFRTAIANLGVFDTLFKLVEAEFKTVMAKQLTARQDAEAITAEDFPLDRVTITQGGGLVFGDIPTPIQMGGAVTQHFVPTPARGGGRSIVAKAPPVFLPKLTRFNTPGTGGSGVDGVAFLRGLGTVLVAHYTHFKKLNLSTQTQADLGLGLTQNHTGVTQTRNLASQTVYVSGGDRGQFIYWYEPSGNAPATGIFTTLPTNVNMGGTFALAATSSRVYLVPYGSGNQTMRVFPQSDPSASRVVQANGATVTVNNAWSMAVDDHPSSPTIFYGTQSGEVLVVRDGGATAPLTLAQFTGFEIRGLALAGPTLFVSLFNNSNQDDKLMALNVSQTPVSSYVLLAQTGTAIATSTDFDNPRGLSLELDSGGAPVNLYMGAQNDRVLRLQFGSL
ncbi:MAG: hypothetical protein VKP62_06055 [Candidatus Sericytochromatia bacterium]|nr:hypothetical protein [Candidatus Sericytochromatia bacterium]